MRTLKLLLTVTPLLLACIASSSCSVPRQPDPPRVLSCPKPVIDPQLLAPAETQALTRLEDFLSQPETKPSGMQPGSTLSSPK